MPGPKMHQNSLEQCRELLNNLNLPLDVGNKIEVMEPDRDKYGSHGWDFTRSNTGSIINKMETRFNNIKQLFFGCNKDVSKLAKPAFSREVRFLCHYTTDAHSIGQLSSKLWGRKDTRIDIACEFIPKMKLYTVGLRSYSSVEAIRTEVLKSMRGVYDEYYKQALKWNFIFKKAMRSMGREAIKKGAEFTASWIELALKET